MFLVKLLLIVAMMAIDADVAGGAAAGGAAAGGAAAPKVLPITGTVPEGINITVYAIPYSGTEEMDLVAEKQKMEEIVKLLNKTMDQIKKFQDNNNEILKNATFEENAHHPRVHNEKAQGNNGSPSPNHGLPFLFLAVISITAVAAATCLLG